MPRSNWSDFLNLPFPISTTPNSCNKSDLDQATTQFREMEMNWWLEQAEALGKGLGAD